MKFVNNETENEKNEQLLTWLKVVHSKDILMSMVFNDNEENIKNSSVILKVDKFQTTASTLANLSDYFYRQENYTNYSNLSKNSNFFNYTDEQYNLSLSTEYIFDRTDVRVIFIILYSLVFCCCFFGNLLVILVVTLSRRLRSITNFFLANLAVADFCVGLFCVLQNLSIYLIDSWVFGEFLCRMYQFVHSLSYTASIFILVVICTERYFAIVHPITCKQLLTAPRLRFIILTVWITSALCSTPKFIFSKTIKNIHTESGQEEEICILDRKMFNSKLMDVINFLLLYVIPLIVMTVLYSKIAVALWRSSHGISSHFIQMKSCSTLRSDNLLHNQHHNPQDYYSHNYHHTCHHSFNHNNNYHLYQQTNFSHEAEYSSSSEQSHLHRRSCQTHSKFSKSQSSDDETLSGIKKTVNNNDRTTIKSTLHANKNLIKSPQTESICTYWKQHNKASVNNQMQFQSNIKPKVKRSSSFHHLTLHQEQASIEHYPDTQSSNVGHLDLETHYNRRLPERRSLSVRLDLHRRPQQQSKNQRHSVPLSSSSSQNLLRARRGVVRMLIIFVLTFAICNLPYHARKMWQYWSRSYRGDSNFNALLTPLTFLVAYFNSGINPLLYAFLSRNFRKGMHELMMCSWRRSKMRFSTNSSLHRRQYTGGTAGVTITENDINVI